MKIKIFCHCSFFPGRAKDLTAPLYMRAIWASHYQGHSTTDFQQMSKSIRSCAPLHVAIHNCKISPHAAVRSVGFRAIN